MTTHLTICVVWVSEQDVNSNLDQNQTTVSDSNWKYKDNKVSWCNKPFKHQDAHAASQAFSSSSSRSTNPSSSASLRRSAALYLLISNHVLPERDWCQRRYNRRTTMCASHHVWPFVHKRIGSSELLQEGRNLFWLQRQKRNCERG